MTDPMVEYAVGAEHGEIIPRPTQAAAQQTVDGIRAHGGTAVLLSRTVVRSDWVEVEPGDRYDVEVPRYPVTDEEIAALPVLDMGAFHRAQDDGGPA